METEMHGEWKEEGRIVSIFRSAQNKREWDSLSLHFPHSSLAHATDTRDSSVCLEYQ